MICCITRRYTLLRSHLIMTHRYNPSVVTLTLDGDLLTRQEMRCVNTRQPSLPGDGHFAQVIGSHGKHLLSVQAMTTWLFLVRLLGTRFPHQLMRTNQRRQLTRNITRRLCNVTIARKLVFLRPVERIAAANCVACSRRANVSGGRPDIPLEPVGSNRYSASDFAMLFSRSESCDVKPPRDGGR